MRFAICVFVMVVCAWLCSTSWGADWALWGLGSDNQAATRVEWRASDRMGLFIEGNWREALPENESGLVGGGVGALWYVAPKFDMPIKGFVDFLPNWTVGWLPESIPMGAYVGTRLGAQENNDFSARLLGGFLINPQDKVQIGCEIGYDFTQQDWKEFPAMPTNDRLTAMLSVRVPF